MSPHQNPPAARGAFRSLRIRNYRLWAAGAFVSNIGTWMQRTAQDWLVLVQLTPRSATAVGIVMALQFGPSLVLLPFTGFAADHLDRRRLLFATQGTMGVIALVLGILTLSGAVQLWQVYVLAGLMGCAAAFDAPARQTFVAELVGTTDLSNAVALNSTSFQAARMLGPAVAGVTIAALGTGWAFVANAISYGAVLASLAALRVQDLHRSDRAEPKRGAFADGLHHVAARPDLIAVLVMLALIATFGLNFAIFISTMAVKVFHAGAHEYGLLSSMLAIGSVTGALLSARRANPRMSMLVVGAAVFGTGCIAAAVMPSYWAFGATLVVVGVASQTFMTTANSTVQLSTEPVMRGRVMAIYMAIALGSSPIGGPVVGWVADAFGPRWALGVGGAAGVCAAIVGWAYRRRTRVGGSAAAASR